MQIDLKKQYADAGIISVPRLLDAHRTARLRVISEHCLAQWRLKAGPQNPDAISMCHLNDPAYFTGQKPWLAELLDIAADPSILAVAEEVLADKPLFRSIQLFFNPLHASRDGNWHRDSQFLRPNRNEENQMILDEAQKVAHSGTTSAIQLQIALVPSEDIEYVPASHLRLDTPDENHIRFAENQKFNASNLMPGAARTHQEPGDAVIFNPWGLHRGRYHADKYRRTILFTYTARQLDRLQDYFSDQPWCLSEGYLDGVKPQTKQFFEEFIDAYRTFWNRKR